MYTKKVQILNYGPIGHLDISFPFEDDTPKPVVFVGKNGTGKSILLSHIVNGLAYAQSVAYPRTPEVDTDRVFKIRSGNYIKSGSECYFGRVDFEEGLFSGEVVSRRLKRDYDNMPAELRGAAGKQAWDQMKPDMGDNLISNFVVNESKIKDLYSKNCVLYFPSNRFEDPAWLNEENLTTKAKYMDLTHVSGHTSRRMISYSPLRDIQDWLFDVMFDMYLLESRLQIIAIHQGLNNPPVLGQAIMRHPGPATSIFEVALDVIRRIVREGKNVQPRIGRRNDRVVSLHGDSGPRIPNIFQLSSGETSLLSLIFSILRDFDLCGTSFDAADAAKSVRGIAVVDEIDLHLHAVHQHEILPSLMRMFPRVQFIVTTHSPLFVLGMKEVFGEEGFGLYQLPLGEQIDPEEFSEFASAYQTYSSTSRFASDIRSAVTNAQTPILYLEGTTDCDFVSKAAELLDRTSVVKKFRLEDGNGAPGLGTIWSKISKLPDELVPTRVVLLYDSDQNVECATNVNRFKRKIPHHGDHPIEKGIENLFDKQTLERAKLHKPAFIDIVDEHPRMKRGSRQVVFEEWTVNSDEKRNLCDWLCENGTAEDFRHFQSVLDMLAEILEEGQREV